MVAPVLLRESMGRGIIRALASQFTGLSQAILELCDNPIDYRDGQSLQVHLRFDRPSRLIQILVRGGSGMGPTDYERFLRWGESMHHVSGDIGAYGQGGKAAIAYLGGGFRIWSKERRSNQVWLLEDRAWRSRTEASECVLQPVKEADEPIDLQMSAAAEGCILIEILDCDLARKWNLNILRRQLGSVYRSLIRREILTIWLDGKLVEPIDIELDHSAPNILLGFDEGNVKASGWAGRLDRRKSDQRIMSGLRLYSSGRLITEGEWFGFAWTGKGSYNHLIGELDIDGLQVNLNKSGYVERDDEVWDRMGKAVLAQMQPLLSALRAPSESRVITSSERAAAKSVRDELAATLKDITAEIKRDDAGDEWTYGRRPPTRREEEPAHRPESAPTGRKNQPRTPAPDDAVGTLRRTAIRIRGIPPVQLDSWDPTVRAVIAQDGGKRILKINSAYPLYRLSAASRPYLAETILLELLQADPDVVSKQELVVQLDLLLRRWSDRAMPGDVGWSSDS